MIKISQCKEDRKKEDFESYVNKFVKDKGNEMFVKYPY
jgi:lantibiotic modifying enzyme